RIRHAEEAVVCTQDARARVSSNPSYLNIVSSSPRQHLQCPGMALPVVAIEHAYTARRGLLLFGKSNIEVSVAVEIRHLKRPLVNKVNRAVDLVPHPITVTRIGRVLEP